LALPEGSGLYKPKGRLPDLIKAPLRLEPWINRLPMGCF